MAEVGARLRCVCGARRHDVKPHSYDSCCRVWSTDDWRCVQVMQGHADAVRVLTLDEDGKRLFSGSYDAAVCAWEV